MARQSVVALHPVGMRRARAFFSLPRLVAAVTALAILTLTIPTHSHETAQPTQLFLVCKEPNSSLCLTWPIKLNDSEDITKVFYPNAESRYNCGLSDLKLIPPHRKFIMVKPLNIYGSMKITFCKTINVIFMENLEINGGAYRVRRHIGYSPRGRYRGQTQSQYLAIDRGNGKDEGKAEAHSDADTSRASVVGKSGMGQAQSQSIYDPSCEECYGSADLGAENLKRGSSDFGPGGKPGVRGPNQSGTPGGDGHFVANIPEGHVPLGPNQGTTTGDKFGPNQGGVPGSNFGTNQGNVPGSHFDPNQGSQGGNLGPIQGGAPGSNFGPSQGGVPGGNFGPNQGSLPGGNFGPNQGGLPVGNFGPNQGGLPGGNFGPNQGGLPGGNFGPNQGGLSGSNFGPNQGGLPRGNFGLNQGSLPGGSFGPNQGGLPGGSFGPNQAGVPRGHFGPNQGSHGGNLGPTQGGAPGSNFGPDQGGVPGGNFGPNQSGMPGGNFGPNQGVLPGSNFGPHQGGVPGGNFGPNQGGLPVGNFGLNQGGLPAGNFGPNQGGLPGGNFGSNQGGLPGGNFGPNQGGLPGGNFGPQQGGLPGGSFGPNQAGVPGGHFGPNQGSQGGNVGPTEGGAPGSNFDLNQGVNPTGRNQIPDNRGVILPNQGGLLNGKGPFDANWSLLTGASPGSTYFCCVVGPNNNPQYLGVGGNGLPGSIGQTAFNIEPNAQGKGSYPYLYGPPGGQSLNRPYGSGSSIEPNYSTGNIGLQSPNGPYGMGSNIPYDSGAPGSQNNLTPTRLYGAGTPGGQNIIQTPIGGQNGVQIPNNLYGTGNLGNQRGPYNTDTTRQVGLSTPNIGQDTGTVVGQNGPIVPYSTDRQSGVNVPYGTGGPAGSNVPYTSGQNGINVPYGTGRQNGASIPYSTGKQNGVNVPYGTGGQNVGSPYGSGSLNQNGPYNGQSGPSGVGSVGGGVPNTQYGTGSIAGTKNNGPYGPGSYGGPFGYPYGTQDGGTQFQIRPSGEEVSRPVSFTPGSTGYGSGGPGQPQSSFGNGPFGYENQGVMGHNNEYNGAPQNVLDPNSIAASLDGDDSEALATVTQDANGTIASASSKGGNDKGRAQTQVEGKYTGSGSFSAQAQISDESKGAESQVTGGKQGASSNAQGRGRNNKSQANVQLGSETGSLQTHAQSDGTMHSSNSQVQGSVKGGMADAQARGPGSTSSQAQIGFTPYKEGDKSHELLKTPFVGGGTASSQSSGRTGQSQSQLQGTFKYGITYNGAAQAGASVDKDTVFPNRLPFNKIDVFDENNKNIDVDTEKSSERSSERSLERSSEISTEKTEVTPLPDIPLDTNVITNTTDNETMTNSESRYPSHTHKEHHESGDSQISGSSNPIGNRRSFQPNYGANGADYEYTTDKDDNTADDYDQDGAFGPDGTDVAEVEQGEYTNYDEFSRDPETHQSLSSPSRKGLEVNQATGGNTQHIVLGSLNDHDAEITQRNSEQRPDEGRIYQPGERVPGTGGYTIPIGFTGSIKSVASKEKTYVIGSKDSPSQAQTVSLTPGTGRVKYINPKSTSVYSRNVKPKNLRSLYSPKADDNNRYVSVTKSVTGALDSENNIRKQYSHTYYTKSSSCGYFTFTCTMVSGSNGRKKVCKPKIPTNADGTPMRC